MTNVFLSWSGERSFKVAEALKDWLPMVIQSIVPWFSDTDIGKGARWASEISTQLQDQRIGILCLTSDNLDEPWILFEAGAISKSIGDAFVCPYLLDIRPADVQAPLSQFNATVAEKGDTLNLLHTINKALGNVGIHEKMLDMQFEKWWPDLEEKLAHIPKAEKKKNPRRSDSELLEEILQLTRSIMSAVNRPLASTSPESTQSYEEMIQKYRTLVGVRTRKMTTRQSLMDELMQKVSDSPSPNEIDQLNLLRDQIESDKRMINSYTNRLNLLVERAKEQSPGSARTG